MPKFWLPPALRTGFTRFGTATDNRSGETPQQVLGGTKGTLVVDGYTGYNKVTQVDGRRRAGCLAHARRKLFAAMEGAYSAASDQPFRRYPIIVPTIRSGFEAKRRVRGWLGGGLGVGVGFQAFLAAHGRAAQGEHVSVVHEPVADGVGDSRIAERLVPTFRRQL